MAQTDVVIVGAGLAGLCCGLALSERGVSVRIVEASDGVGGRIRTDHFEGFLLDRGFQVLLTAYPEARRLLDYPALDLQAFEPGALVQFNGDRYKVVDPWRKPMEALGTVFSPIGTAADKLLVARLRSQVMKGDYRELFLRSETTTEARLTEAGFTASMIDRFFRPFFGGILLDSGLGVSSRMFDFVFRMLACGDNALPARGMEEIPKQLAERLPAGSLRLNAVAAGVDAAGVTLADGERVEANAVVVACDAPRAADFAPAAAAVGSRRVACFYYDAPEPPVEGGWLVLNGDGTGPINNLCVPSSVAPAYAPPGRALVSVSVLTEVTDTQVREQLGYWFGAGVREWTHLRTYQIRHAQPAAADLSEDGRSVRVRPGLYVAGDHVTTPSIQGAMVAGARAAQAVLDDARG